MRWADASLRKEITGTIIASLYSISLGVGSEEEVVRKSSRQTKEHRMSRHVALNQEPFPPFPPWPLSLPFLLSVASVTIEIKDTV